ncbi:hypothetical protein RSK20926_12694 [Roseobacter sp. SK209-2-6]|nr:hypothetical protein [Roseobacter sp. SK209-2-6]EBA18580.1 hypothetical protein RSK20926_12694 [Roseobacter sp. SK209-2-6]
MAASSAILSESSTDWRGQLRDVGEAAGLGGIPLLILTMLGI